MDPAHADDEEDATVRAQNDDVAEQDDPMMKLSGTCTVLPICPAAQACILVERNSESSQGCSDPGVEILVHSSARGAQAPSSEESKTNRCDEAIAALQPPLHAGLYERGTESS